MENSERDMEQIRRHIIEKLRWRFAQMEQGNTEKFDRVLALWIDLNRAILLLEKPAGPKSDFAPWESANDAVRNAWDKLTHPDNLLSLESLFYQMPEGPQMGLARKALTFCRERHARKGY